MVLTNIELYEALKRDLSEDAARMIAEVIPPAGDLATKGDVFAVKADIAELRAEMNELGADLKSYIDSRLLRYTAAIVVPLSVRMLGTLGALVTLVIRA